MLPIWHYLFVMISDDGKPLILHLPKLSPWRSRAVELSGASQMTCESVSLLVPHYRPAQLSLPGPSLVSVVPQSHCPHPQQTFSISSSQVPLLLVLLPHLAHDAVSTLENVRVLDREGGFADDFEEGPMLLLIDVLRAPIAFSFSSTLSASGRFRFVGLNSCSINACAERDHLQGGIVYLNQASR